MRSVRREIDGEPIVAYAVDASPALAVQHAVLELAPRRPSLVVSGINFGLNMGNEVTISGTVGAALEAGAFGIPALAVSLEMDPGYHLTGDAAASYAAAAAFAQRFAWHQLTYAPSHDVDALNINVPSDATPSTPWRLTRLSRQRYFVPLAPDRTAGRGRPGYRELDSLGQVEVDSDIWAIKADGIVSVTPLSLDLTSRLDLYAASAYLQAEVNACQGVIDAVSLDAWASCASPDVRQRGEALLAL
jgi:5'-nucleotidase